MNIESGGIVGLKTSEDSGEKGGSTDELRNIGIN